MDLVVGLVGRGQEGKGQEGKALEVEMALHME
jgi:hypothetical protein